MASVGRRGMRHHPAFASAGQRPKEAGLRPALAAIIRPVAEGSTVVHAPVTNFTDKRRTAGSIPPRLSGETIRRLRFSPIEEDLT